jgi:hypothetical protein
LLVQPRRSFLVIGGGLTMVVAALVLAACAQATTPEDGPTSAVPSASVSASPTPTTPPAPALYPEGTADENLPYFALVTQQVWAGPERMAGRAYIDALVAAGFDKSRMQVTRDQTAIGNAADSIQFSVAWDDQCLIGQAGAAFPEPATVVLPILEGGTCLIGDTRPIDW